MSIIIPATVAQVDTAKECVRLVYDDQFLVVRPEEHTDSSMIRMSEYLKVELIER